jgi:hypothetical protein
MPGNQTEIGVIVVHGIGEQRRFEHLDAHVRGIIDALKARANTTVTVEISSAAGAIFRADQDSWSAGPGPAVRILVRRPGHRDTMLNCHEVWWADVNETYSLAKQIRFWAWGMAMWMYPAGPQLPLTPDDRIWSPQRPRWRHWWAQAFLKARLLVVADLFLTASLTLGLLAVVLKRLLNLNAPAVIQTFVNYIGAVKLYNQPHRGGANLIAGGADFLDTLDDPPRVSVRRRMMRVLADVACQPYERWYVLAHSQGSVVAFNGLMETAYAWPGYLDEPRWAELMARGLAGPARPDWDPPAVCRPARSGPVRPMSSIADACSNGFAAC